MSGRNNRMRRRGYGDTVATIIVITVLVLFFISAILFLKVNEVEIIGLDYYTEDEILDCIDVKKGSSLLLVKSDKLREDICSKLIRVGDVRIKKKIPSKLSISVTETVPVGIVRVGINRWVIDEECRALGEYNSDTDSELMTISGIIPTKAKQGEVLTVDAGDASALNHLSKALKAFKNIGILKGISWIDVSNISNIEFYYDTRFKVELGSSENIDYKLTKMLKVIDKLEDSDKGKLYLSTEGKTIFTPEE